MVKFTYEKKWRDEWFSSLTPHEKFLFMYFCDIADCAGYIEKNARCFIFETGLNESEIDCAIKGLGRGLAGASEGLGRGLAGARQGLARGYWLKNHIKHQKNLPLNPKNNSHRGIVKRLIEVSCEFPEVMKFLSDNILSGSTLEDFNSDKQISPYPAPPQPLPRGTGKEIGIGKEREEGSGGKGDEAHLKLAGHPELRGLTWEMSLIARKSWPGGDYLGTADQIIAQAVLGSPITKPGVWLQSQYAKLASGIPLVRAWGKKDEPAEKRKVFLGIEQDQEVAP